MTSPLLSGSQVYKLRHLLYMKYKPTEIANELGVSVETVYRNYIPAGAPHERDGSGHVWIVGTTFAEWARDYLSARRSRPKLTMRENDAYCLHCNKVVNMVNKTRKGINKRGVVLYSGKCPDCKGKLSRLVKRESAADNA